MAGSRRPPNPEVGHAAESAIAQARRDAEHALSTGELAINSLFTMEETETEKGGRVFGHMHLRTVLMAIPHIGAKHADHILSDLGLEGDRHIASLGHDERHKILAEVDSYS